MTSCLDTPRPLFPCLLVLPDSRGSRGREAQQQPLPSLFHRQRLYAVLSITHRERGSLPHRHAILRSPYGISLLSPMSDLSAESQKRSVPRSSPALRLLFPPLPTHRQIASAPRTHLQALLIRHHESSNLVHVWLTTKHSLPLPPPRQARDDEAPASARPPPARCCKVPYF